MVDLSELADIASQPLSAAYSLPFAAYTDADVYRAEAERMFARDCVFVCMAGELPNIGDYLALQIMGEPVVILRDDGGALRALSNTCRHRGTILLDEGFGQIDRHIVCPYHA